MELNQEIRDILRLINTKLSYGNVFCSVNYSFKFNQMLPDKYKFNEKLFIDEKRDWSWIKK